MFGSFITSCRRFLPQETNVQAMDLDGLDSGRFCPTVLCSLPNSVSFFSSTVLWWQWMYPSRTVCLAQILLQCPGVILNERIDMTKSCTQVSSMYNCVSIVCVIAEICDRLKFNLLLLYFAHVLIANTRTCICVEVHKSRRCITIYTFSHQKYS